MNRSEQDEYFMRAALAIAEEGRGLTDFAPSIGCVIVKDGEIIARGRTQNGGVPHAEETALNQLDEISMAEGATAYVTLEPCATPDPGAGVCCTELLIKAKIARVVMAAIDPDPKTNGVGLQRLQAAGIETDVGLLRGDAVAQNLWFFQSRAESAG